MRKFVSLIFFLTFYICLSHSQSGCEVRGLGGNWISGPAMTGNPPTVTTNVTSRSEYKIYCSSNNTWYPTGDNPWTNGGGNVTFTLTTDPKALAVEASMNFDICAPGAFSGWNNSNAMVQNGNQWCVTVPNAGTYEWKPTKCGSWDSWEFSNKRRNVNPPNWSVTTTTSNQSVCLNYNPFTGEVGSGFLPVNWLEFEVKSENKRNKIYWSTASEINNEHFEVLYSTDGENFEYLGNVKGNGTKSTESKYEFIHESPPFSFTFYRIRQVDFDGTSSYSDIKFVKNITKEFTLYPNPTNNEVYISGTNIEEFDIVIWDHSGNEVYKSFHHGENKVDLSTLQPGLFFVKVSTSGNLQYFKLLKL
jgi:hypothetical protein